jgi:hypothetical protein
VNSRRITLYVSQSRAMSWVRTKSFLVYGLPFGCFAGGLGSANRDCRGSDSKVIPSSFSMLLCPGSSIVFPSEEIVSSCNTIEIDTVKTEVNAALIQVQLASDQQI